MPLLRDPVVTLEDIRLLKISLSSLELDVKVRVDNPNPLGITLRKLPFTVLYASGDTLQELAAGDTGTVKIAANGSTVLQIPIASENAALVSAFAAFATGGGLQITVRGKALVDAIIFSWSVPFEKTLPVTIGQAVRSLAGRGNAS